jgi:hypothetical protein
MNRISAFAALAMLLPAASAAGAQSMLIPDVIGATIGNMAAAAGEYRDCLQGKKPARAEAVAAARAGADAAIRTYIAAAGAGPGADVSAAFTAKAKQRSWRRGGVDGAVTGVEDPLALAVAAGRAELTGPTSFVRSGNGASALALWRVGAVADSAPIGHYRVGFRREAKLWKLTRMELIEFPAEPDPVAYYCATPGDSEDYAKAVAERKAERERKRAARAERQAARSASR